jgi:3-oxoacyl-[acyl-carrier protein] reductase
MLKGKTALITGANGGIGKSIVNLFLKNNANVICLIRKSDQKFNNFTKKLSKNITIIESDLTDESNLKTQVEKVFSKNRKLDILVNNAGIASGSIIEMTSQKNLKEIFNVNFFSQIRLTQLVLKYLKNSKKSSIINIGSISAKMADRGTLAYGCSKIALMHATKIMANEFSNYKIRVNGICPNATNTKMLKKMDPKSKNVLISRSFMKKVCEPIDVANLILYLSSKNSEYINGQIIFMDGGMEC